MDMSPDQVAGDYKKNINSSEPAGNSGHSCVKENDRKDGDRAQTIDVGAVVALAWVLHRGNRLSALTVIDANLLCDSEWPEFYQS